MSIEPPMLQLSYSGPPRVEQDSSPQQFKDLRCIQILMLLFKCFHKPLIKQRYKLFEKNKPIPSLLDLDLCVGICIVLAYVGYKNKHNTNEESGWMQRAVH